MPDSLFTVQARPISSCDCNCHDVQLKWPLLLHHASKVTRVTESQMSAHEPYRVCYSFPLFTFLIGDLKQGYNLHTFWIIPWYNFFSAFGNVLLYSAWFWLEKIAHLMCKYFFLIHVCKLPFCSKFLCVYNILIVWKEVV
jgi:hypothetical protein